MRPRVYPNGPVAFGYVNEGGGTRKTSSAVNTAVALAKQGKKVLLFDGDQTMQCSAYVGWGLSDRSPLFKTKEQLARIERVYTRLAKLPNIFDLLHGRLTLQEVMLPARTRIGEGDGEEAFAVIPNLYVVIGSRELEHASDDLARSSTADRNWMRRALSELPPGTIDVVIVDFRGGYLAFEESMLSALDFVIGVFRPDSKDVSTLGTMLASLDKATRNFQFSGGAADLRYVLLNGVITNRGAYYIQKGNDLQEQYAPILLATEKLVEEEVPGSKTTRKVKKKVFCVISESVRFAESVEAQEPIHYWDPNGQGASEFDDVVAGIEPIWA